MQYSTLFQDMRTYREGKIGHHINMATPSFGGIGVGPLIGMCEYPEGSLRTSMALCAFLYLKGSLSTLIS